MDPTPVTSAEDADALIITEEMIESAPPLPRAALPLNATEPAIDPKTGRRDFERGMSYWPLLTLGLIVANVAVFGWELFTGALESRESIIAAGALHRASVLAGEWWRLGSAVFLHGSFEHLVGNCLILYIVGMACEHGLGVLKTAALYAIAALVGSGLSVTLSEGPSVGASGAIFGLVAAAVAFLYRHQRLYHVRDKRIGFVLAGWALYTLGVGFLTPLVDNAAHAGGALAGAGLGLLLAPRALRETPATATVV